MANSGRWAVTGNHQCIVIKCHELLLNGTDDLWMRAAPKIGAADTFCKESVARKQDVTITGQMETDASWSVAGCMDHSDLDAATRNSVAILYEAIDGTTFGDGHS